MKEGSEEEKSPETSESMCSSGLRLEIFVWMQFPIFLMQEKKSRIFYPLFPEDP